LISPPGGTTVNTVGDSDKTLTVEPDLTATAVDDGLPFSEGMGTAESVGVVACVPLSRIHTAPATLGTMLCRRGPSLRLVIICKAAFSLDSTPMEPMAAPRIFLADVHHRGRPMARVIVPGDMVPGRTRVDVTLDGHACAPRDEQLAEMAVRLTLRQDGVAAIDKPLLVMGDLDGDEQPQPFSMMPIAYERAAGGAGFDANPIGVVGSDEHPNIVNPSQPERPAGYGPIAAVWPARMKLLRPEHKARLRTAIMDLPDDMDWRYFQAAPLDQQIESLAPDTAIALSGFNPDEPTIAAQLPGARAVGVIFGVDAATHGRPLTFRADSLHIHADELSCVVTWRAVVEVGVGPGAEDGLGRMVVAAGVETGRGTIELPSEPPPAKRRRRKPLVVPERDAPDKGETLSIDSMGDVTGALPFDGEPIGD
jgi:hypothetical protein